MARNPVVQELLDKFVVPNAMTGKQRAIWTLYRTLANALGRDLEDSGELVEALHLLLRSRELAVVGGLNPRPVPEGATTQTTGIQGGAGRPDVRVN